MLSLSAGAETTALVETSSKAPRRGQISRVSLPMISYAGGSVDMRLEEPKPGYVGGGWHFAGAAVDSLSSTEFFEDQYTVHCFSLASGLLYERFCGS